MSVETNISNLSKKIGKDVNFLLIRMSWIELCASSVIEPEIVEETDTKIITRYNNGSTDYFRHVSKPYQNQSDYFYIKNQSNEDVIIAQRVHSKIPSKL